MTKIQFNTQSILKTFYTAKELLLEKKNIWEIKYIGFDHTTFDKIEENRNLLLKVSKKSVVYCIWTGDSPKNLLPKYVGHVADSLAQQRIRAHLTYHNERTGSQLEKVKEELKGEKCIGISIIEIDPPYMRKALEEWLIIDLTKDAKALKWNKNGRSKTKISNP